MVVRVGRKMIVVVVALALGVSTAGLGGDTAAAQGAGAAGCDSRCQEDLERARAATGKYWDSSVAVRDGFVASTQCQSWPQGASSGEIRGTMGTQFANLGRSSDQRVDVEQPESLLFMPEGYSGGHRLLALEYSVPFDGQPRPVLFGRQFNGPEAARTPGLPQQYYLRVWLYSENPDGLFAPANPAEGCDAKGLVDWHLRTENCLEVTGTISVEENQVRKVGNVPDQFQLRSGEVPGTVEINVGSHLCELGVLPDGTTVEPLMFGHYTALVDPPDWVGVDEPFGLASRYLLRFLFNSPDVAKAIGQGMGVGSDVFAHSPDLKREFSPIAGVGPTYRYTTPDFVLNAVVAGPAPGEVPDPARVWRETSRGLGEALVGFNISGLGAAAVQVTPKPGSLLANVVGCDSGAASCEPIIAEEGLVVAFHTTRVRVTASSQSPIPFGV